MTYLWQRWVAGFLVVVSSLLAAPGDAGAMQVSDDFVRVAKELSKRWAQNEIRTLCDARPPAQKVPCEAVVAATADLLLIAIDGSRDPARVSAALVNQFRDLARSAFALESRLLFAEMLAAVAPPGLDKQAPALSNAVAECLVSHALRGKAGSRAACAPARQLLPTWIRALDPNAVPVADASLEGLLEQLRAVALKVPDFKQRYQALVLLTQLAALFEHAPRSAYDLVETAVTQGDQLLKQLDHTGGYSLFDDGKIARLAVAAADASCSPAPALVARVAAWERARFEVHAKIGRALALGQGPAAADLAAIPSDLPDSTCPPGSASFRQVVAFRNAAIGYGVDVRIATRVQALALPALAVALLVDFAVRGDQELLHEHLDDFALRALARAIAAVDPSEAEHCAPTKPTDGSNDEPTLEVTCALPDGKPGAHLTLAKAEVTPLIEARYSPRAAQTTCVYQAIAGMLRPELQTGEVTSRTCREVPGLPSYILDFFGDRLPAADKGSSLRRWAAEAFHPLSFGLARLEAPAGANEGVAYRALAEALASWPLPADAHTAATVKALCAAAEGLAGGARNKAPLVFGVAADLLGPRVSALLDDALGDLETCTTSADASTLACGVRTLAEASYGPVIAYLSVENPSDEDRRKLSLDVYRKLQELDPLSNTPVLFNVGPGVTLLAPYSGDKPSGHLTLIDKYGVAWRFGARRSWQVGVFVGGFLDAIVRTASDAKDPQPFWLQGLAGGWRQIDSTFPIGIEVFAANALPFELRQIKSTASFALGLNVVVPADVVFSNEEEP